MQCIQVMRYDGFRTVVFGHLSRISTDQINGPGSCIGLMAYLLPDGELVSVLPNGTFIDLQDRTYVALPSLREAAND